ncbi:hypothetical protein Droror1_Dr00012409 [Drosera rotundifolia]
MRSFLHTNLVLSAFVVLFLMDGFASTVIVAASLPKMMMKSRQDETNILHRHAKMKFPGRTLRFSEHGDKVDFYEAENMEKPLMMRLRASKKPPPAPALDSTPAAPDRH